jgi:GAF domain-containing protein
MQSQDQKFLEAGVKFLAQSTDLKSVLTNLVRLAAQAAGSNSGSLYLVDHQRGVLKPYVLYNLPESYVAGCKEVPLGTQCCGRAALHKMPWVVSDMWTDPLFADCREAAQASGMRAAFSVPVIGAGDRCIGSLASHFTECYTPTDYAIERNKLFAQLIAFAIAKDQSARDARAAAAG